MQYPSPTQPAFTLHLRPTLHSMWGYNQPTHPYTPKIIQSIKDLGNLTDPIVSPQLTWATRATLAVKQ
ncbi:Deoxyhypusine synthase-like protein [Gossypium arboreum]|uniref:Deoxyhypusine synthase-like protein n=1 Tax=Gossypium arboreum TaxID=29729 RepID=A0A0B0PBG1_GOSAR|nr:Deoxyhypusine synthase-like protein [Gossypium arboreum]